MSDAVLFMPVAFQIVSKNPAQVTVSHTERPPSELAQLRARCAALTESERVQKANVARAATQLKALGVSFQRSFEEFAAATERAAVRELTALSLRLAEVILRHQLPDREMIQDVIRRTLAPLYDMQGVRVRLSPADARALASEQAEGRATDLAGGIEIVADAALAPGDVTVETPGGHFNARISERLKLLDEQLGERARGARQETHSGPGSGGRAAGAP
jgi:flagellar biosynthesis/type III secretory pathway protein FliH